MLSKFYVEKTFKNYNNTCYQIKSYHITTDVILHLLKNITCNQSKRAQCPIIACSMVNTKCVNLGIYGLIVCKNSTSSMTKRGFEPISSQKLYVYPCVERLSVMVIMIYENLVMCE